MGTTKKIKSSVAGKKKKEAKSWKKRIIGGFIQLGILILVAAILSFVSVYRRDMPVSKYVRNYLWMFGVWFFVTIVAAWLIQLVVRWIRKRDASLDAKPKVVTEKKSKGQKALSAAGKGAKWIIYIVGIYFLVVFSIMAVAFSLITFSH